MCSVYEYFVLLVSQPSPSEILRHWPDRSFSGRFWKNPPFDLMPLSRKKAPWKFNWNLRVAIICRHLREGLIIRPTHPAQSFSSISSEPHQLTISSELHQNKPKPHQLLQDQKNKNKTNCIILYYCLISISRVILIPAEITFPTV